MATKAPARRAQGGGPRATPDQKRVYWQKVEDGWTQRAAAAAAGVSESTSKRWEKAERWLHASAVSQPTAPSAPRPKLVKELRPEAKQALTTFPLFQRRYFGRIAVPWQAEAAETVVRLLESPEEEYVVINAPPGVGKSTTFTHDIAAWITVRDRSIRGQIGSLTARQAKWYVGRLRRTFASTIPAKAETNDLRLGLSIDAEATLAMDYGRFEPEAAEKWTEEEFIVLQESGVAITEKEATWSAFGKDSGFLGGRYDIVIWDDLTDPKKIKTVTARDELKEWFGDVAETRLEPGGLLVLQGQRMGADDIYRYALDLEALEFDEEGEEIEDSGIRKYHHVRFRAHYEELCAPGTHKRTSAPWPEGCCLYPRRLPYSKIATQERNREDRFRVLYQQEDADPEDALVQIEWIEGTKGFPGCLDRDRAMREIPMGLAAPLSVVTCDPSPANRWGVGWWVVEQVSGLRYLVDLFNGKMEAPDLLDWDDRLGRFTGLMDSWQHLSMELGYPITHWVMEINGAQRFLRQYRHALRWQELHRVAFIDHTTGRNKADPDYGVQTIATPFREGRYRLPWKAGTAATIGGTGRLVKELTRYGQMRTDDLVMMTWFLEHNLANLRPARRTPIRLQRPSWLVPRGA